MAERERRGFGGTQASRGLALDLHEKTRQTTVGAELGLLKVHTEVSPSKLFRACAVQIKSFPRPQRRKGAHLVVGLRQGRGRGAKLGPTLDLALGPVSLVFPHCSSSPRLSTACWLSSSAHST